MDGRLIEFRSMEELRNVNKQNGQFFCYNYHEWDFLFLLYYIYFVHLSDRVRLLFLTHNNDNQSIEQVSPFIKVG